MGQKMQRQQKFVIWICNDLGILLGFREKIALKNLPQKTVETLSSVHCPTQAQLPCSVLGSQEAG